MIKLQFKKNRVIIYLILQTIVATLYYLGSVTAFFKAKLIPLTSVDYYVKPHFLAPWIYISFFLLLLFAVYFSTQKNMFLFIKLLLSNSIIALVIFILFPTYIINNDYFILQESSPISYQLLNFIKQNDVQSNCFPSLHIANSLLATMFIFKLKNKLASIFCSVWFILITWSVLSTGQHYFYDIIGGFLLSLTSYYGFAKLMFKKNDIIF